MKILKLITEARKNPDHPVQKKVYDIAVLDKYKKMSDEDIENLYISFTSVDKLGINPRSSYDTPIGVYTYPLKYVLGLDRPADVPWAGESQNMWIIRAKSPVLKLADYKNLGNDVDKLTNFLRQQGYEQQEIVALANEAMSEARKNTNMEASRMWNFSRIVGRELGRDSDSTRTGDKGRQLSVDTVYFNVALRKALGYKIIRDDGLGIIHSFEPIQAVFLSRDSFDIVEKIKNPVGSFDPSDGKHPIRGIKNIEKSDYVITYPRGQSGVGYIILRSNHQQFQQFMGLEEYVMFNGKITPNGWQYTLHDYIGDFYGLNTYSGVPNYNPQENFRKIVKFIEENPKVKDRLVARLNARVTHKLNMDKRLRQFMHDFFPEQDALIKW